MLAISRFVRTTIFGDILFLTPIVLSGSFPCAIQIANS